ncbi:hypothetical protein [Catenovulum adriaticum]|uniref:Poly A polymerase head domain-containing protein n=1 Tax=Catenovulum adriaticum TaxID=2984846 RepID=A0ABY7ARJ1_9ALTE|nr:hypothetical protein [Catenovulum sp. TS8]WAJ70871.1 hypothetical protein OLW01_03410 [Catenovulum sp. TS8]
MTKIATSSSILRQRIQRFLYAPHNAGRLQVAQLVEQLSHGGPVYLFGGAIRDFALDGIRYFNSDLDFVVHCPAPELAKIMRDIKQSHPVHTNKFGGYRVKCDKWWLDIWPLEETWAFKQNWVKLTQPQALLKTTITNWDAALFDLSNQKLLLAPHYFDDLNQGILKLNLSQNPNPQGTLLRLLRCLISKPVTWLDTHLFEYLSTCLSPPQIAQLRQYEKVQYSSCYLAQISDELIQLQLSQPISASGLIANRLYQLNLELDYHD